MSDKESTIAFSVAMIGLVLSLIIGGIKIMNQDKDEQIIQLQDRIHFLEDALYEVTREKRRTDLCPLCEQNKRLWYYDSTREENCKIEEGFYDSEYGIAIKSANDKNYLIYCNSSEYSADRFPISYCPMCGKKLS